MNVLPLFIALPQNKASKLCICSILISAIETLVLFLGLVAMRLLTAYSMQNWMMGSPGNGDNETHTFTSTVACMSVVLLLLFLYVCCVVYVPITFSE